MQVGRKARRQRHRSAVGQKLVIFAVLIHNRQPLDAPGCRAAFRNIHDPGVKIAFFAGQTFVNGIGNHVSNAAPVVFGGGKRLSFQLFFGKNVPQAKFHPQIVGVDFRNSALHQRNRIDRFPVAEARQFVDRIEFLNIAVFGDNAKQPRTFKVGNDHFADSFAVIGSAAAARHLWKSDRHRFAHGAVNVNLQFGAGGRDQKPERQHNVIYNFHLIPWNFKVLLVP